MNGKGGDGDLIKTFIARDFILRLKCSRKHLAAGIRPDSLGEHRRFSRTHTVNVGQGMDHSLATVRGHCVVWWEEQSKVVGEDWEVRTGRERTGKVIQPPSLSPSVYLQEAPYK